MRSYLSIAVAALFVVASEAFMMPAAAGRPESTLQVSFYFGP